MSGAPVVVAVSGPPGSGKSALAGALTACLPGAVLLSYDDFETFTANPPEVVADWLDRGGDPEELDLQAFAEALKRLAAGQPAPRPSGPPIAPGSVIVVDTPFGRAPRAVAHLVDLVAWLDTPPDVALARKVRQFAGACLAEGEPMEALRFVHWLEGYLGHYPAFVRRACALQRSRVRPDANLVLTGEEPLTEAADRVAAALSRRMETRLKGDGA